MRLAFGHWPPLSCDKRAKCSHQTESAEVETNGVVLRNRSIVAMHGHEKSQGARWADSERDRLFIAVLI